MTVLEILKWPNQILVESCVKVEKITQEIRTFIDDMAETLKASGGIGLAAPQVGSRSQIMIVDLRPIDTELGEHSRLYEFINPEIIQVSSSLRESFEGCLSLPGFFETIQRPKTLKIKALNRIGKEFVLEAKDQLASCIAHEFDHLGGILMFNRLSRLKAQIFEKKMAKETNKMIVQSIMDDFKYII